MTLSAVATSLLGIGLSVAATGSAAAQAEAQEHALYEVIIERFVGPEIRRLVLIDSTNATRVSEGTFAELRQQGAETPEGLLEDFNTRNALPLAISDSISSSVPVERIGRAELDSLIQSVLPEPWDSEYDWLRRHFAGAPGVISLSRPGFSLAADVALVRVGFQCGSRCGDLSYVLLRRTDSGWMIEHWITVLRS